MFSLDTTHRFELYKHPTDMRKSFDSLCGIVRGNLGKDPTSGTVYIFINKVRNKMKLLHWQSGGFVLYYKRLELGTFSLPPYSKETGSLDLSYTQLVLLIDGVVVTSMTKKKRYKKV